MPEKKNFLIGFGERLTEPIPHPPRKGEKKSAYSFEEAQARLVPMIAQTNRALNELPDAACPENHAVSVLTIHPEYLAKSYYPGALLRSAGLSAVGSRPCRVKPEKWAKKRDPEEVETVELFVEGRRDEFSQWAERVPAWTESTTGAKELHRLERISTFRAEEKLKPIASKEEQLVLEVVLHASADRRSAFILEGFEAYLETLGLRADFDRRFYASGLCFMPLPAPSNKVSEIADFSFVRVVREMPRLRTIAPLVRGLSARPFSCELPQDAPLDPQLRVAVFDGGSSAGDRFPDWIEVHEPASTGPAKDDFIEHGDWVNSALLFGPLSDGDPVPRPVAAIDHYRVLDESSDTDPYELYDALKRIEDVLESTSHSFINLSIGPALPIEDDDVHAWTSVLDQHLSNGDVLAAVAVGNTGENDWASGNARIQVPSDCVNALAVGAADAGGKRAFYSSVGPGRSPGVVKPDLLAFGGDQSTPFSVAILPPSGTTASAEPIMGTSFATPLALRMALAVRAHFGEALSPLALRALLVHSCNDGGHSRREVGWGSLPSDLSELVTCADGTARIIYKGTLDAGKYLRARIPMPEEQLAGNVTIRATLCFATETDPGDPSNYTRAGLDVVFRPHDEKFSEEDSMNPKTGTFFQLKDFSTEKELRRDAFKWETTLHKQVTKRGSSLNNPVFDIHYNARESGAPINTSNRIRYALVITVSSRRTSDLYDQIIRRYRTQLQPLQPTIQIPVTT